jgi:phosphotransferase system IIB component
MSHHVMTCELPRQLESFVAIDVAAQEWSNIRMSFLVFRHLALQFARLFALLARLRVNMVAYKVKDALVLKIIMQSQQRSAVERPFQTFGVWALVFFVNSRFLYRNQRRRHRVAIAIYGCLSYRKYLAGFQVNIIDIQHTYTRLRQSLKCISVHSAALECRIMITTSTDVEPGSDQFEIVCNTNEFTNQMRHIVHGAIS